MGKGTTSRGVTPKGDRIQIRFTWKGQVLRPTLNLKPTAANLKHAVRQREEILEEIRLGTFVLTQHFPDYRFAERHVALGAEGEAPGRDFSDWAEVYLKFVAREVEHSSVTVYRNHLNYYWVTEFGALHPRQITHEMIRSRLADLATDHFDEARGEVVMGVSRKTQNNIMIPLRGVMDLACRELKIPNPVDGIKNLKTQGADPDPFTVEEVDLILADIRAQRDGITAEQAEALADYYEFAAFGGTRASEQIAATWPDLDSRQRMLRIGRAKVLGKTKDRTKTHVARIIELNDRAWAVIERQRARTFAQAKKLGNVIFVNPSTGNAWAGTDEQRKEWVEACSRAGVRYRPPKELRDTSVTSALLAGADPYWVAQMHGHSLQTMLKDYARFIPKGDRGRNLAAVNRAIAARSDESALEEH